MAAITTSLVVAVLTVVVPPEATAMIRGGEGNKPLDDPGWPKGAAALVNHPGRVAWWEGPPFGGGEWHAECRGDAKALGAVLADFARIDGKIRRVVVHDGPGHSFWLAPNREPEKLAAARIDWALTVWQAANWEHLRTLPASLNPTDPKDNTPPARIDVYTGGLRWADVTVPPGVEVIDQRLEAHGFTAADGAVIEGKATDLATGGPLAATARLQRVEPQETGGYRYPLTAEARADASGRWVLKNAPAGWLRVVVEADGYASRVVGHLRADDQPRWQSFDGGLARTATVSGRVLDFDGNPLDGAEVQVRDLLPENGGRYETPAPASVRTDADGRFRAEGLPAGEATLWVAKIGYVRPGLGLGVALPKGDVTLRMMKSAGVRVVVDFAGKARPEGYLVSIEPEKGEAVGRYGGSGQIDGANRMTFEDVPPGRYVLRGRPNPSSGDDRTEPVAVDLKGGETAKVTLKAR